MPDAPSLPCESGLFCSFGVVPGFIPAWTRNTVSPRSGGFGGGQYQLRMPGGPHIPTAARGVAALDSFPLILRGGIEQQGESNGQKKEIS